MKKLFGLGLAALSLFAVAACDNGGSQTKGEATPLNVAVNYSGACSISYQQATPYEGLDGVTYSQGDILPVWKEIESRLNLKFTDVIVGSNADEQYDQYAADSFNGVDVISSTTSKLNSGGNNDVILDLNEYIDRMPNLKRLMENNPDIKASCYTDGSLYFAPYYDGYGEPQRYIELRADWVKQILTTDVSQIDEKAVDASTFKYTKFNTYTGTTPVKIAVKDANGNVSSTNLVKQTSSSTDVIAAQSTATTNRELITALKNHLQTVYGAQVGAGKIYADYSEIFTSISAAYDTDELIALMRCVYNSSKFLTGTEQEIAMLIPRETANNRMVDVARWGAQVFGARGLSSTNGFLYIDGTGQVQDGRCTDQFVTMMEKMHQLYEEHLIAQNYNDKTQALYEGQYRANVKNDRVFMGWDFLNSSVDACTKRTDGTYAGYVGILPPMVKWDVAYGNNQYYQFNECARGIKSDAWGIPARLASDEKKLNAALSLIDYLYSEEGNELISYGPSQWHVENGTKTSALTGETIKNFKFSDEARADFDSKGQSWINYLRYYVGANVCVGYIRDANVEIDLAFNDLCKDGHDMLIAAKTAKSFITASGAGESGSGTAFQNYTKNVPSFGLSASEDSDQSSVASTINNAFGNNAPYKYIIYGFGGSVSTSETLYTADEYRALWAPGSDFATKFIASYQSAYARYLEELA